MSDRIRTALFGGTFNPLHNGHLTIVKSVLEQGLADEVWILITPCNPWKKDQALLDDRLRYDMVAQAVKDLDGVRASDFEFKLDKPSYTANTLRRISAEYPDREFILTVGADNWVKFHNWKEADFILNNYPIIVYPRQGYPIESLSGNVTLLDSSGNIQRASGLMSSRKWALGWLMVSLHLAAPLPMNHTGCLSRNSL